MTTALELDGRLTFDTYIVGTSNRLAAAAARRIADAPGTAYNPLFLYSASGLGKTHLIMAIGNHIRRVHPDMEVMYDTLEHLMEGVMEAIQAGERDAFRSRLRGASVLLLDDVQFLAGRRGAPGTVCQRTAGRSSSPAIGRQRKSIRWTSACCRASPVASLPT
jgi:chromosomal replication initiator protein